MTYNVYLTNNTLAKTVQDGAVDSTYSVLLVGKGVADYASSMAQNSIRQLENFALDTPPANPLTGQLWYNRSNNVLNVYNGQNWLPLNGTVNTSTINTLNSTAITSTQANLNSITGASLVYATARINNLTVSGNLALNNLAATTVSAQSLGGKFNGSVGLATPNTGAFTSLTATSVTAGTVSGSFTGAIGSTAANIGKFTNVNANQITANLFLGATSGPVNQSGMKYPGTFTSLVADNLQINSNFGAAAVTAQTLAGTLTTANQPNITRVGTLANLTVTGNMTVADITARMVAGQLTTAYQPGITSVGTLANLNITGTATVGGNVNAAGLKATYVTGQLMTASQPNITRVGVLSQLTVSTPILGSVTGSAAYAASSNSAIYASYVTGNVQPQIQSLPNINNLVVRGLADLGDPEHIVISGGRPNYVLGMDANNHFGWQPISSLQSQPTVVDTNQPTKNRLLASDYVNVILSANEPAHTAHPVLTVDCTNLRSAEIYLQFREAVTQEYYSGTIAITLLNNNTYRVEAVSFAGGKDSAIQISGNDSFDGLPTYFLPSDIKISVWNADTRNNFTRTGANVQDIKWYWVKKMDRLTDQLYNY